MNMIAPPVRTRPTFVVLPAAEAQSFLQDHSKRAFETQKAEDILARAERRADDIIGFATIQAERMTKAAQSAVAAMEQRIAAEAEETAERTAALLETKQQAIEALSAMEQVTAIAADYAQLDSWITDTVLSAVRSIVADMAPQDRCTGQIRAALARTKDRWNLVLSCHPDDYPMTLAAVAQGNFEDAITNVICDATVAPGVCYLKSATDHVELNMPVQLEALHAEIAASLHQTGDSHAP
ncbi:MAG: FliH/SctL family protein [Pseudomonadota bacterium]